MSDVLVIGGGPAGASAAQLLARWGHRVRLITRTPAANKLAVSIAPSAVKLLDVLEVTAAIDGAGFIRSTGNTVYWGGDEARVERFADGALGWQVELLRISELLLAHASAHGVTVNQSAITVGGLIDPDRHIVLDCTGRAGVVARLKEARQYDDGPRTIALVGEWLTGGSWSVADDTHTVIESYCDGWMWSVPIAPGVRHVSAMVDPQRSGLARGGSSRDAYLAEIAKTREFKRLLHGAALQGGPWGHDASIYRATEYAGDGWLLVGDAGSFVDPLSSAGVKKALASAWLAAVVVNTCARTPSMRKHAFDFFSAREREIEQHYARESRAFLAAAARGHDRPFWVERSQDAPATPGEANETRRAFDALRRATEIRLTPAPQLRIEQRPMVDGNEIRLAAHVISADSSAIRYLSNVDVVVLLELAPRVTQVHDLFEAYARRVRPVPLHDFLMAVSAAVARGWLVAE